MFLRQQFEEQQQLKPDATLFWGVGEKDVSDGRVLVGHDAKQVGGWSPQN